MASRGAGEGSGGTSAPTGLTCCNRHGTGFFLSRESWRPLLMTRSDEQIRRIRAGRVGAMLVFVGLVFAPGGSGAQAPVTVGSTEITSTETTQADRYGDTTDRRAVSSGR